MLYICFSFLYIFLRVSVSTADVVMNPEERNTALAMNMYILGHFIIILAEIFFKIGIEIKVEVVASKK